MSIVPHSDDAYLQDQLKRIPRQAAHYAPYDENYGVERILPDDLSVSKLWKQWCSEHDTEFYEQAVRVKFWRSYDKKSQWPRTEELVLKPKLSHTSYARHFNVYDLRFGAPRVDMCEVCDSFLARIKACDDAAKTLKLQVALETLMQAM